MQSYHDMMTNAVFQAKKEIDMYFDYKVKEYEKILVQTDNVFFPEEVYRGINTPALYFMYFDQQNWDILLFNRKLIEYKPAYILNGREFFDAAFTLPVSKGWEYYCDKKASNDYINLSCHHTYKARELKLSFKEYNDQYLASRGGAL